MGTSTTFDVRTGGSHRAGSTGALPLRSALVRQLDYWLVGYLRTWRASAVTSFLEPLLYLAAMGVGIGSYVDPGRRAAAIAGQSGGRDNCLQIDQETAQELRAIRNE